MGMVDKVPGKEKPPVDRGAEAASAAATTIPKMKTVGRRRRPDARIGQLLDGRFEITRLVARGGMGKIYEALQQPLGRRVALKVMDLGFAEDLDPDFQKRFFLEASTCANLSHPNTIRVFDYGSTGEESDTYFIAMEFIEGQTLLHRIEAEAPLDPLRVIHIARQICASLREAHEQGVIHRDLKPSNVLLTRHGDVTDFVKVLDFGLVKLMQEDAEEMTKSGLFLGSPNYMSPEQIRADGIDQRSDIYSLGVLLYMGLTATSPFKRESSVKVLLAQLEEPPAPFASVVPGGSIPASLEWVVMTCLEKSPANRFHSVSELSRALRACEAELRGMIPGELQPSLEAGALVLPPECEEAISLAWPSVPTHSAVPPVQPTAVADPVPSEGSLISNRLRDEVTSNESKATEPSVMALQPNPRKRRRRRPKKKSMLPAVMVLAFGVLLLGLLLAGLRLAGNLGGETKSDPLQLDDSSHLIEIEGSDEGVPDTDTRSELPSSAGVSPTPASESSSSPDVPSTERPSSTRSRATSSTKRTRRKKAPTRSRTRSERTKSESRSTETEQAVGSGSVSRDESKVGSSSAGDSSSRKDEASSESSPVKKKKGDLKDPWEKED